MPDRPRIICHMTSSIDGRLHPSRYTASPDGAVKDWSGLYERIHAELGGDAWIVGRTTMAEMSKATPHPPAGAAAPERPKHIARRDAKPYAVALDRFGKLHFDGGAVGGDAAVVLLGSDVSDAHLAELAADGVSYLVSDGPDIDLEAALAVLKTDLGIDTLLLEGGGAINGSFLAAGLVDELSVVVCPALDGESGADGIVAADGGLKDKVRLSLSACTALDYGAVHLRYAVTPA
jgi:riboflavin biosynthesis pyrimidine reductase